ncbi:MAG: hypothetical protein HZA93_05900 [Verrucomicrobia bacterium]|nr:hypothetical protein [Verrucomicrobiota bacterium]
MAQQLTADDAKQSLAAHVGTKGLEIFSKYGPTIDWVSLTRLLGDRAYVRYPVEIAFDDRQLLPGEFAQPVQKGDRPEDGFTMCVHPVYQTQPELVPALVLYQLVAVNYGVFASSDDAETFGAAALGLTRDEYYALICDAADQLGFGAESDLADAPSSGCGTGCGCGH